MMFPPRVPSFELRPRPLKFVAFAALCGVFTAAGIFMVSDGDRRGWLVFAIFSVCELVFLAQLVPSASYLRLTEDGFFLRSLFREQFFRWSDVREFRVERVGRNRMVVFDFVDGPERQQKIRQLARALSGADAALPDSYGRNLQELATLMNNWKAGIRTFDR